MITAQQRIGAYLILTAPWVAFLIFLARDWT